jgi:hypothetical protein
MLRQSGSPCTWVPLLTEFQHMGMGRHSHGSLTKELKQRFPCRSVCLKGTVPTYSLKRKLHGSQRWLRKFGDEHFLLCRKSNRNYSVTQPLAWAIPVSFVERNSVNTNLQRKIANKSFRQCTQAYFVRDTLFRKPDDHPIICSLGIFH